ncbi:MAG: hypothetical protein GY711_31655 [bacterium]|nr:hypothetical protein [bacterium]
MIDFKGDLANYRKEINHARTMDACALYYDRISAMKKGFKWKDLLDKTFEIKVDKLDANVIKGEVKKALKEYRKAAKKIDLKLHRESGRSSSDAHTCVQWVFVDNKWVAVYNYNLWSKTYPTGPLKAAQGAQDQDELGALRQIPRDRQLQSVGLTHDIRPTA